MTDVGKMRRQCSGSPNDEFMARKWKIATMYFHGDTRSVAPVELVGKLQLPRHLFGNLHVITPL
jgi:hypothetical protein